jgi:hypothetical protein
MTRAVSIDRRAFGPLPVRAALQDIEWAEISQRVVFRAEGCLACNFLDNDQHFLDSHSWSCALG